MLPGALLPGAAGAMVVVTELVELMSGVFMFELGPLSPLLDTGSPPATLTSIVGDGGIPVVLCPLATLPVFRVFYRLSIIDHRLLIIFGAGGW